jgi:type IV pilus assembly protein PilE
MADKGFTLLELAIVVLVAALLAALAMPSFSESLRRARRSDAVSALTQLQLSQERWRSDHPAYATDLAALGLTERSEQGLYRIAVTAADGQGHVATATATGLQQDDLACTALRLEQAEGRLRYSSVDSHGREDASVPNRCWTP